MQNNVNQTQISKQKESKNGQQSSKSVKGKKKKRINQIQIEDFEQSNKRNDKSKKDDNKKLEQDQQKFNDNCRNQLPSLRDSIQATIEIEQQTQYMPRAESQQSSRSSQNGGNSTRKAVQVKNLLNNSGINLQTPKASMMSPPGITSPNLRQSMPDLSFKQSSLLQINSPELIRPSTPQYSVINVNFDAGKLTPKMSAQNIDRFSLSMYSNMSDVFSQSQSTFKKIKITKIELDTIIKEYDQNKPKFLQININEVYFKTGLPKVPAAVNPKNEISQLTKEVFMVHNLLRVYKQLTIELLEDYKGFFKNGNQLVIGDNAFPLQTQEGTFAVQNAIDYLKSQPPLKPIYFNKLMSKIAKKHAEDCSERGQSSHIGGDGTKPIDRMRKYGQVFYGGAENIQSGKLNPFEIIISLIVDDGFQTRGHRINLFNPSHRTMGVSSVSHKIYGTFTVIKYAFYYVSHTQKNKVQDLIDQWNADDKKINEDMFEDPNDKYEFKIQFEYPHLIKKNNIIRAGGQMETYEDSKDLDHIIYKD